MGQRKSTLSKGSYDVAPKVGENEIKYKRGRAAPNFAAREIPDIIVSAESGSTDIMEETQADSFDLKLVLNWINQECFIDILKAQFEDFKEVTNFKATPTKKPTDNTKTLLLQVEMDVVMKDKSTKNICFMLKLLLDNEQVLQSPKLLNFLAPETSMYFDVLPRLEEMYRTIGINVCFGPKTYQFEKHPETPVILMDDLHGSGFKNFNQPDSFDMKHTEIVLLKLAQFHAASVCYVESKGPFPDVLKKASAFEADKQFSAMGTSFLNNLKNVKDGEKYYEPLKAKWKLLEDEQGHLETLIDSNAINVLNHGNCWSNNILFRYDADGNIAETRFVDFQKPIWGSPAYDLYNFLLASVNIDIKLKHFEYFVRYYHEHLIENLRALNFNRKLPTLRELHADMLNHGSVALRTAVMILPVVLLDSTGLENNTGTVELGLDCMSLTLSNERYCQYIGELLPWMHQQGILQVPLPAEMSITEVKTAPEAIPAWIDEEHFTDILLEAMPDFSKLLKITASPAAMAGDNYASIILRVTADTQLKDGTTKQCSFMLKVAPSSQDTQAFFNMMNVFPKELEMYRDLIPEFEKLYKSVYVDVSFGPKSYKFKKYPGCETVLMEDLRLSGFKNTNRLEGLDMEHTKCVLYKLSQWHAASVKHVELKGCFAEHFMQGLYSEKCREMLEAMSKASIPVILECIREYENNAEYIDKVILLLNNFVGKNAVMHKVDPNEFNVLNHGDLWSNNIMFQHDQAGKVSETKFVDFQMCLYGSPAIDLYYFLLSSTQLDIKVDQFDNLIKYYHEQLVHHMNLLKCTKQAPTLKELQCTLKKYGILAFGAVIGTTTICLLEPSEQANFESFSNDNPDSLSFRKQLYTNKRYRAHAMRVLPWLKKRGLLDE